MIERKKFFAIRGYNKSGTNWVCRLLNTHPDVSGNGEFHWHRLTMQMLETVNESETLAGKEGLVDKMWHRMDRFIKESIALANDEYATWVGDRTPCHIEPSIIMGARVFNLVRDGRDVLVSAAYHYFNNPEFFPEYDEVSEMQNLLKYFRADKNYFLRNPEQLLSCREFVHNVAHNWHDTIVSNREKIRQHPEMKVMELSYEDVHHDTEGMRTKMFEFLEVDPSMASPLSFNTEPGFGKEMPDRFLRKGVVGDWKNYFTPEVKQKFVELSGESLISLGYEASRDWDTFLTSDGTSTLESHSPVENASTESKNTAETTTSVANNLDSKPDPKAVAKTVTMMSEARTLLAYGGLDGVVQRPMFDHDGGVFPHFAVAADGCRIIDSVGRTYIDWMNGWGPVLLGYNRPEVSEAIRSQLSAGPTLSFMHPVEIEVSKLLCEMIPCAEMVAFGKNGSDSVNASLRIARAATKRKMILQCGFHGFHEWYTCLHPNVQGMPDGLREQVEPFPYNDLAALEALLEKHKDCVAAVIMEPVNLKIPDEGYLEGVRALTEKHGCLLIFDEMVTAFRLGNGGAQEYFGVVPDLCCIGKGMANGMPLSAIVGKREYMQLLPACGFGMTFRGETLSLVAAKAVLELLIREPVCKHLADVGEKVREQFESLAQRLGLNCVLAGPSARMTIEFHDCGDHSQDLIRSLFLQESLKHGVVTHGTLLPNYAHDDQAIAETMVAFEAALKVVARAIESGLMDNSRPHGGSPTGPRAFVSNGFLERLEKKAGHLKLQGWMLLEDGAPDSIELHSANGQVFPAKCARRPDLEEAFPNQPTAIAAGYEAELPESEFHHADHLEFHIVAKRGNQVAFRCLVVLQETQGSETRANEGGPFSTNDGVLYI